MKNIAVSLLICFLVAFAAAKPSISLDVFHQSNAWWLAVAVRDADVDTRTIQIKQADASSWEPMEFTNGWGYYTIYARGVPLQFPMSVRLTAVNGKEITLNNAITSFAAGVVNTNMNYDGGVAPTQAATKAPTQAATQAATKAPTDAPTQAATQAATKAPTAAPTKAATSAPTKAATSAPSKAATNAPTKAATSAPSKAATNAPTKAATAAPTKAPTAAPTKAATKTPTAAPTRAATKAPTAAPTRAATAAPTAVPTIKPTIKPSSAATTRPTSAPTSGCNAPLKLMVPLYMYPGTQWDTLIASSKGVETVAIINPSSGPGTSGPSNSFKTYMTKFDQAGIEMIGYVHTSYGTRSISTVKKEIDEYASKFPSVVGIFLDEVSAKDSELPYYKELYEYIMSMPGWKYDVINPGAVTTAGYLNAATQIVSFETDASKFSSGSNPSFASCSNKDKFVAITYGASSSGMQSFVNTARSKGYYGWVYATDGTLNGGTYNKLPAYYADMAKYIADGN